MGFWVSVWRLILSTALLSLGGTATGDGMVMGLDGEIEGFLLLVLMFKVRDFSGLGVSGMSGILNHSDSVCCSKVSGKGLESVEARESERLRILEGGWGMDGMGLVGMNLVGMRLEVCWSGVGWFEV